jgi:hypothetical protein
LLEFAANYGRSLDWIVLGDLDPTIRRLYAIGTMTTIRRRRWREAALDHPVGLAAQVAGALFRGEGCRIAGKHQRRAVLAVTPSVTLMLLASSRN